jgi:hypothetical protein
MGQDRSSAGSLAGKWAGTVFGTNHGHFFMELDHVNDQATGMLRLDDQRYGLCAFSVAGCGNRISQLQLSPAVAPEGVELRPVAVKVGIDQEGRLIGDWNTDEGRAGILVASRLSSMEGVDADQSPASIPTYDVSVFRRRGARREPRVPACTVTVEVFKRIFRSLAEASRQLVQLQVGQIRDGLKAPTSPEEAAQLEHRLRTEEARLRALNAVGLILEAADGKLIWECDESALDSDMLPTPLRRITFEIGFVARFLETQQKLPSSATVVLDFGKPPAFDISDPSIAPTPNASSIVVYGTDETWVYGVSSSLEGLISRSRTHRDWLHARHTYQLLLFALGIPAALSASGLFHNWLGLGIEQHAGTFVATSFIVVVFLFFLYLFRLGFSLLRWLYPYIEMTAEPKPLYARLRNVWSAILLSIPGGVITAGLAKLVGW